MVSVVTGLIVCLSTIVPVWADEDDPYQTIISANEAFETGKFAEALEGYESALQALGESPELDYNRAAAHYKLGQRQAAANLFAAAALSPDDGLSRRARFNWGNCDYAAVLSELQSASPEADTQPDLAGAMEKLASAIQHYRDALASDSDRPSAEAVDRAARANIERAQRLIDLIKELQQQQQQQQQQQDDQNQQQDQQQEDQQDRSDQQQEQQPGQEQQEQQNQQQQEQQQDRQQGQQDQQQQERGEPQEQERRMTPDEVEAVLQAVRDKEKQRREEQARKVRARRVPVVKDW